jgi:hypothetical protein
MLSHKPAPCNIYWKSIPIRFQSFSTGFQNVYMTSDCPPLTEIQTSITLTLIHQFMWKIGYDGVRLTSQNCGLYGPFVHPRVILQFGPWMMILTGANSQLVYQSTLAAPVLSSSSVRRDISGSNQYCLISCHLRSLWSEWAKEMRI